jgi:hypothetical protein
VDSRISNLNPAYSASTIHLELVRRVRALGTRSGWTGILLSLTASFRSQTGRSSRLQSRSLNGGVQS